MKTFKQILILSIFTFFGFVNQTDAQIIDSLPYFKMDLLFADGFEFDIMKSYDIPLSQKNIIKASATKTPNLRVISTTVVVNHEEQYFKIRAKRSKDCEDCQLIWWDKNEDKKIQPKTELRCGSLKRNHMGKLEGRKIPLKTTKKKH